MKYIIRIPTLQYAYLETEFEGTAEEAINEHEKILFLYNNRKPYEEQGLAPKDWNKLLDRYLTENSIDMEEYSKLSNRQQLLINEIKKSLLRIANKS